jgi:polyphosphate glucokinase
MVAGVKKVSRDWKYDAVSIGFPEPMLRYRPVADPVNLEAGELSLISDAPTAVA